MAPCPIAEAPPAQIFTFSVTCVIGALASVIAILLILLIYRKVSSDVSSQNFVKHNQSSKNQVLVSSSVQLKYLQRLLMAPLSVYRTASFKNHRTSVNTVHCAHTLIISKTAACCLHLNCRHGNEFSECDIPLVMKNKTKQKWINESILACISISS